MINQTPTEEYQNFHRKFKAGKKNKLGNHGTSPGSKTMSKNSQTKTTETLSERWEARTMEIQRLLKMGSIREVKYSTWIANVVI